MNTLRNVSPNPHVRDKATTQNIMKWVFITLLPATAFGIYNFGIKALLVVVTCVLSSVFFEHTYYIVSKGKVDFGSKDSSKLVRFKKFIKSFITKDTVVKDYTAAVTGLLLAMNVPHTLPLWICVVGSMFGIVFVKQLFGGLGQNFMNPALGARAFLVASFAGYMTKFEAPINSVDAYSGATPLALVKAGESVDVMAMLIGRTAGTIGETSAIAILIGAGILLYMKIIDYKIPFIYIGTFSILVILFGGHGFDISYLLAHIFGGGLMLGAFFMATDYVTSPVTPKGKVVFAIILGFLTAMFRIFGGSAEGVSYAIIFTNLLVPIIEKYTIPKPFGYVKPAKKVEA